MKKSLRQLFDSFSTRLLSLLPIGGQLVVLLIVAVVLLLPAPLEPNQVPAASPSSDLMISHWLTALVIQRTFAQEHQLPLWNPTFGGGQPLGADSLAALFYPPTQLVHFFPLPNYFLILMIGHLVFAGLGMLLLARSAFGLSRLPALVAAVSFMATPRLISHLGAGHVTILQTVAWFPWLVLACRATVQDPRRKGALLGICIGMMLLAGHPQMAYYGLLMVAGLASWLLVKRWRSQGWRALVAPVVGLSVAAMVGIMLAAIHLLPLMEFTARSTRAISVSSSDTFPLPNLLWGLINPPRPSGVYWEAMMTPGLLVLALALLALVINWRKFWPLALGIVVIGSLAMGNASPVYWLVAHVLPDFDRFRGLARIWFVALLLFALLAGLGADSLVQVVMKRIRGHGRVIPGFVLILAVAFSLILLERGYAHTGDIQPATTPSALARSAAQMAGSGRIYGVQGNIPQLSAAQLQVRLAHGWDPLLIQSFATFMYQAGGYKADGYQLHIPAAIADLPSVQPSAQLLGLMHVSVVVSRRPLTDPRLIQVGEIDGVILYKNAADAGPGYLVKAGSDGHAPATLDEIQQIPFDMHESNPAREQETYRFSSSTGGYFVVANPAFPGWTAELDGHAVPVELMAGVLPAVKVGPGMHVLSYTYAPPSVRIGMLLSLSGLMMVVLWFVVGYRMSREVKAVLA